MISPITLVIFSLPRLVISLPTACIKSSRNTTKSAIKYLYACLSQKHGETLFYRTIAYLRQAGGLNETELEDMLSADDEVLQSIFVHYLPPLKVFRLPSNLWIRIRNDMSKYLVEKTVDDTPVIYL